MNSKSENWKYVVGFEGLYEVSDLGRIRSCPRIKQRTPPYSAMKVKGRILSQYLGHGYPVVSMRKNGVMHRTVVHRLVASAFVPNPLNKPGVNHISGIKTDNSVGNLEWCNQSENTLHAYRVLGATPSRSMKGRTGSSSHMAKKVYQLSENGEVLNVFGCGQEAGEALGLTRANVLTICRRKSSPNGFILRHSPPGIRQRPI